MTEEEDNRQLYSLLEYLKRTRNFDFSNYKRTSLERRMNRRMQVVGAPTYSDYQDYLEVHPEEFLPLFNSIFINVTSFFRDPLAWDFLRGNILPTVVANKPVDEPLRVWSAGCSSGEEPCTLAIILAEILGKKAFQERVKIYATDVDEDALNQARRGIYTEKDLQAVPLELREKYFEAGNNRFTLISDLRRSIIFGRHDLFRDAPISRLDVLVCRNTLMYFNSDIQGQILARFHFALNERSYLFLGKAEMLLKQTALFTPVELRHHIFAKVPNISLRDRLINFAGPMDGGQMANIETRELIQFEAFNASPQALIVFDNNNTLVMYNAQAHLLFGLTDKDLKRPLPDLEISYRPLDLRPLLEQAYNERHAVVRSNVLYHQPGGAEYYLDIQISLLQTVEGKVLGVSMAFSNVTRYQELKDDLQRYTHELETAYEELQSSNEELETTNEELQSAVEELETTNEELQSSNEEMETMNEELQSTNEELQTINDEMRTRTDELNTVNSFLQSILSSLNSGVAVVDRNLNVLIWNRRAENLWGLRSEEVRSHSFLTLDIGLPVEALAAPFRSILDGKTEVEELVLQAINRRGITFSCHVVCNPFLGNESERQGIVVVMDTIEKGSDGPE